MKISVDGRELDVDGIRVGELCEAEKALGVNMSDGSGAAIAVTLFVGLRREDKQKPAGALADEVMRADVTTIAEADDAGPPAEGADEESSSPAPDTRRTSGVPLSARSA